ncbi:MAG: hypothetical protein K6B43_09415 [Treponema sp.]|nr:hypothetical protein [Treponema sp.]
MTSGQKVAVSLLVSVVLFAVFTVFAFVGMFNFVETKFYQPMVVEGIEERLVKISDAQERYIESLFKRFDSFVSDESVKTYLDAKPLDSDVQKREKIRVGLMMDTRALRGIRIIDSTGINILYSSFSSDVMSSSSSSTTYKKYSDLVFAKVDSEIPYVDIKVADTRIGGIGKSKLNRIYLDDERNRVVFSMPFTDSSEKYAGTIAFYCDPSDFSRFLFEENLVDITGYGFLITDSDGFGGYVFGLSNVGRTSLKNLILEQWNDDSKKNASSEKSNLSVRYIVPEIDSHMADSENHAAQNPEAETDSADFEKYNDVKILFSKKSFRDDIGFISWIYDRDIMYFSESVRFMLLVLTFVTLFLIVYLIFNLRHDDMVVIRKRIKQFQLAFISESIEQMDERNGRRLDIESRKDEINAEIKKSLGRRGKKYSSQIDSLLNSSWSDIFTALGLRSDGKQSVAIDSDELRRVLEEVLGNGSLTINANVKTLAPAENSPAEENKASEPETIEENKTQADEPSSTAQIETADEVEKAENTDEAEEISETETVEDVEEAENADEIEEVESVEEVEEVENADEIEEVESVEEVEEVENAEEIEEVESVEEVAEVENAEEIEEVESVEEVAEVESADEAEEIEEVESVEEIEEAETADEVEEIEEAESADETGEIENSENSVSRKVSLEKTPFEESETADEIEEVESVEEVEEVENADEVAEAESVEDVEDVESAEEIEDVESVEEVAEAENADEVEEIEEVAEAESVEEVESVDEAEEIEEAESADEIGEIENSENSVSRKVSLEKTPVEESETADEIEEVESAEDAEEIEEVESVEDVEEAESVEEIEDVESAEEIEEAEDAEEIEEVESADDDEDSEEDGIDSAELWDDEASGKNDEDEIEEIESAESFEEYVPLSKNSASEDEEYEELEELEDVDISYFDSEKSRKTYNINDDPYFKELLTFSSIERRVNDPVGDKVAKDFNAYPLDLTFGKGKIDGADAPADDVIPLLEEDDGSMFSLTKFSTGDNVSDLCSE